MSGQTPIARVALDLPLPRFFDFLAPGAIEDDIGRLVIVPFGNKALVGLLVELAGTSEVPPEKLKPLGHIQRTLPRFAAADMALLRFCESYYHHPLGQIALNALPAAMRTPKPYLARSARVARVTAAGQSALATLPVRAAAQRALLSAIAQAPQDVDLLRATYPRAAATLSILQKKQWTEIASVAAASLPAATAPATVFTPGPALNEAQSGAVAAIVDTLGRFAPVLLAGITGSGKTEVYLRAIEATLQRGQQALVLVPEINLTPAFLRQIEQRFPDARIVTQHSALAAGPRLAGFLDAQAGRAHIVIGTRLAAFTPMPALGLIVVDEEHDASFKQQEGFRYSARDVAVFRAQQAQCPVILGSATPSLESLQNVARGRFAQLTLSTRAVTDAVLPIISFIDLAIERTSDGLSKALIEAIEATVKRREQALVFINRRGFAPALVCGQCGSVPHCGRCSARLVFHQKERRLKCHHCGFQSRVPSACADCGSAELIAAGQGSERVEAALQARLPQARIARVDRDSTRRRGSAEAIFSAAARAEIDVLVGTQMLAKGHDFPRLTLVGVVNADGAMFSADFRAGERMAAQLMQVAGRAGRAALPGRVLIQTRFATHPLYRAVAAQDYSAFAALTLAERKLASLPPFSFLALLRAEAKSAEAVDNFMQQAGDAAHALATSHASLQVWDPVPAPLARKAGFERRQLMLQADSRNGLQRFLAAWLGTVRTIDAGRVKWLIDVDPLEV